MFVPIFFYIFCSSRYYLLNILLYPIKAWGLPKKNNIPWGMSEQLRHSLGGGIANLLGGMTRTNLLFIVENGYSLRYWNMGYPIQVTHWNMGYPWGGAVFNIILEYPIGPILYYIHSGENNPLEYGVPYFQTNPYV